MSRIVSVLLLLTSAITGVILFANSDDSPRQWAGMGQNVANWRSQPAEEKISRSNVASLSVKWTFTTGSDVSATPTVVGDAVYFPDWAGNLYAVSKNDGHEIWSHKISEYNKHIGSISRVSPAVHGDDVIIGDIVSPNNAHDGANLMAVNRQTGNLSWIAHVDSHPAAIITGSPVVAGDVVYVGISSNEEALAVTPTYPCCSFRGSVVALDADTGRLLWKSYTLPDNFGGTDGYSGNAIWQPPAIDMARGVLYVGTGNNYEVPDSVKTCIGQNEMASQPSCFAADDYYDSALALDLTTGQVRWSRRLQGVDVWTVACSRSPNAASCPLPKSPDYDFSGSGPNLLPEIVGFGQKSGMYWALNPETGEIVWSTVVGPGATLGGIEWGTATDGERIYAAVTNSGKKPYKLIDGRTITWGAWSALDVATGRILWQTADPDRALDMGSVSVANGVVYAPSMSGKMHALDSSTGKVLWSYQSNGSVVDGPSIVDGVVF